LTDLLRTLNAVDVVDSSSFARYAQQRIGTPMPTSSRDFSILNAKLRDCFVCEPLVTWDSLASLVDWARAKHRRTASAWGLLGLVRYAWKDGILPELDPDPYAVDIGVERQIDAALEQETDEWWQRRLAGAISVDNQRAALKAWRQRKEADGEALL
jgi:hypothetical protein